DFDPARLDQVIEVAPRGNAAQAGEIGNLHCRQVAAGLVQDAGDEVEGWPRQALGECFATTLPENGVEGIDRVLVRLRELLEPLVHRGVTLQLLLKGSEAKRLDQVVDDAALHRGPQALHVARGGDGDDVDPGGAAFADRAHDVQPRDVGQVDVEEEKVRLRLCDQSQRLRSRSCLGHHAEARYLFDVGSVERRDTEIVVHDQRADHDAPTDAGFALRGSRTVNKAPPWLITVTSPPRRAATCCTSARPSPRREPGPASLVVKPSEKIWPRSLRLIPGPESCT